MPEKFTNRELGMILAEFKETTHDTLTRIETQVTSTNGRVKRLELWRMFLVGAWTVVTLMLPLMGYLIIQQFHNLNQSIDGRITTAIERYDEENFQNSINNK